MEKELEESRAALVSAVSPIQRRYDFSEMYHEFRSLQGELLENREVLKNEASSTAKKLDAIFGDMLSTVEEAEDCFKYVEARAHEFDLDEMTKASGYWSLLLFASVLVKQARNGVNIFTKRRNSMFFIWESYLRDIRYTSLALSTVSSCLKICKHTMVRSQDKNLILQNDNHSYTELMNSFGGVNQFVLYGRFNSQQLSESHGRAVRFTSRLLAAYSEIYYRDGGLLTALWRALKVTTDESQRAMRSVVISQYASPSFFKGFMSLTESGLLAFVAKCQVKVILPVCIDKLMHLQPMPLQLTTTKGDSVEIPIPTSHIGPTPLPVRLLSKDRRSGMEENVSGGRPPSDELVLHFHGGGFMGHTSFSHEGYLRSWARCLDCPVASVDYSLSPEVPYPRPLEEAFFAYCYAMKHPEKFGWTGKKIVLAGDSAGGHLITGLLIKCIQFDVRLPQGAVMIYAPLIAAPVTSPGRFLVLLDPVISIGFLASSLSSYANKTDHLKRYEDHEGKLKVDVSHLKDIMEGGSMSDQLDFPSGSPGNASGTHTSENDLEEQMKRDAFNPAPFCLDDFELPQDPCLSPLIASDDVLRKFPPVSLVTCEYDTFIDDNVEMAKRLRHLGVQTHLEVLEKLNHAFLNFAMLSEPARKGSARCCELIAGHLRS